MQGKDKTNEEHERHKHGTRNASRGVDATEREERQTMEVVDVHLHHHRNIFLVRVRLDERERSYETYARGASKGNHQGEVVGKELSSQHERHPFHTRVRGRAGRSW